MIGLSNTHDAQLRNDAMLVFDPDLVHEHQTVRIKPALQLPHPLEGELR